MAGFLRSRAVPQEGEVRARRTLGRAVAMLKRYQENGLTVISIEDTLTLLATDPDSVPAPRETPPVPGADPLTGAMWAGPPGSSPPR